MNATTDGSDSLRELVAEAAAAEQQYRALNYVNLAAFVLLLFDYLITFDCEVRLAWGRRLSAARAICLLNRYFSLLLFFVSLVPLLPADDPVSCKAVNYMVQPLTALLYAIWAAFSGLRIYAISNHNRPVTFAVGLLALAPVATNIFLDTRILAYFTPTDGCSSQVLVSADLYLRLTIVTRACLMVSEAIVIIVTWMNTWNKDRSSTLQVGAQTSFMALVLREGIVYFVIVFALNVLQIVFTIVESNSFGLVLQFLNVLTPILISRFYFDLDELQSQERMTTLPSGRSTTLRFMTQHEPTTADACSQGSVCDYDDTSPILVRQETSWASAASKPPFM